MERRDSSRRAFLHHSLNAAAAMAVLGFAAELPEAARAKERRCAPIRLGGPAFADTEDPAELARTHRKLGYSAAYCPNVSLNDSAKIRAYADAFAELDVVIAEV